MRPLLVVIASPAGVYRGGTVSEPGGDPCWEAEAESESQAEPDEPIREKYVPPLIAELGEKLRRSPDAEGDQVLASIKRGLECTRATEGDIVAQVDAEEVLS